MRVRLIDGPDYTGIRFRMRKGGTPDKAMALAQRGIGGVSLPVAIDRTVKHIKMTQVEEGLTLAERTVVMLQRRIDREPYVFTLPVTGRNLRFLDVTRALNSFSTKERAGQLFGEKVKNIFERLERDGERYRTDASYFEPEPLAEVGHKISADLFIPWFNNKFGRDFRLPTRDELFATFEFKPLSGLVWTSDRSEESFPVLYNSRGDVHTVIPVNTSDCCGFGGDILSVPSDYVHASLRLVESMA